MRIGVDGRKIPEADRRGPVGSLGRAHELGLAGLFFRTVLDMSPNLDQGRLRDIRARADELGMYLETGLGKVNPFALPESPEIRAVGEGDVLLGFRRMMEACADIGCRELWVATAAYKPDYVGRWAYDRFRTDVPWTEQLAATERFLRRLAPVARDLGIHLNLETHEEVTSFELVRLVESVGADVVGIVFDTANVVQRVEHPTWAARRVAPYVRQSHIKDAAVLYDDGGLVYQMRPCGGGVVDFAEVLPILAEANPELNLTIENDQSMDDRPRPRRKMLVEIFQPDFLAAHPDLTVAETAAFMEMVHTYEQRVRAGELPDWQAYAAQPYGDAEAVRYVQDSAAHLRAICDTARLPVEA